MTTTDRFDAPFSATSEEVAADVRRGMELLLGFDLDGLAVLERATAVDAGCVLANVLLGVFRRFEGQSKMAGEHIAAAVAAAPDATDRERSIVALFFDQSDDSPPHRRVSRLQEHMERWPRDFVAQFLSAGIGPPTHEGRAEGYLRLVDAEARMGDDWLYQSHAAMAAQDFGELERAQRLAEQAQAQVPDSVNAAHAMTHVFHERGEIDAGITYVDDWVGQYGRSSMVFFTHLGWHAAVLAWADDRVDEAVDRMRRTYEAPGAGGGMRIVDEASFRWRLLLDDVDNLDWGGLDVVGRQAVEDPGMPVRSWNAGLWAAGRPDPEAIEAITAWPGWGDSGGPAPQPRVVRAAIDGAAHFADGRYEQCLESIEPVLDDIVFLGGSHAQREVFEDTAIAAALRTGRNDVAVPLLESRLERRHWRRDARLLATAGA